MLRRPWSASISLALALALAPSAAGASDRLDATRSEALVEKSHTIDLVMAPDRATMTVRRTVHNGGPRHDQAVFWIELPETAVATGLRTLATVKGRPVWYEGELMEAEAAAAKYRELTGIGGYYPKDPALLSWRDPGYLALQVFPCPPAEDKTVEYTVTLPVEYVDGRSILRLPGLGTEVITADVRVRPADRRDQVLLGDRPVPPGARVRWPEAASTDAITIEEEDDDDSDDDDDDAIDERLEVGADEVLVSLARRDPERLSGRVASVAVGRDRHLREFEIDAAARLSEAPRGAHVVVLLDTSRSLTGEEVQSSIAAARHALAGFPDARVEVVPFARKAEPLFGRFLGLEAALAALEGLTPPRENGSQVDVALARAGELLRRAPRGAPRRILVLTDTLTRESLTPARLRGALATTGALVHVGVPELDGESLLARDDAHAWAPAVRATGGLVWTASVDASTTPRALRRSRDVFEEWVRPLRIDHLRLVAPGLADDDPDLELPPSLDEGEGLRDLRLHAAALPWVRVEGELWAAPLREVFTADRAHGRLWAALVFGSELLGELTEEEMMPLAILGGAVSPVTSYLAIEPGVRPSTEGLAEDEGTIGLGNVGLIGRGGGSGSGSAYGGVAFNHAAWIRGELTRLRAQCSAPPLTLTMESTRDEIVDVAIAGRVDAVTRACVEEGVWAWTLPSAFRDTWHRYEVSAS